MDDYTLLLLAKLRAERRRLEREQRATPLQPQSPHPRNTRRERFRTSRSDAHIL